MQVLYPLLFENNFRPVIWGGNRLKPMKGLPADDERIGESWEISAVEGGVGVVANGPLRGQDLASLTAQYGALMLGSAVARRYGSEFPLLVKYIDAESDLSIQVHPGDELARQRHGCMGKTEMWYVMKAQPGACLYAGFNQQITPYELQKRVEDGSVCEVLQRHPVEAGDVFFIPAGRVHAICGGVMVAEIQQSSDITYRIYDYGRPRELHTALAMEAIDFTVMADYRSRYTHCLNKPVEIVQSPFFTVKLLEVDRPFHRKLFKYDSFIVYMCLEGTCAIEIRSTQGYEKKAMPRADACVVRLTQGNSCLIPASVADFNVTPANPGGVTRLLEAYIDNKNY